MTPTSLYISLPGNRQKLIARKKILKLVLELVLVLDRWSLALVQYLALVNPRHSKGSLCGSKDEDEFEFEDDYLLAGTYDPDIKGEARG